MRVAHFLRTLAMRQELAEQRRVRAMLATDPQFRAFHEGRRVALPEFYHRVYERRLGRYVELIPIRERIPLRRMRARQAASDASVIAS